MRRIVISYFLFALLLVGPGAAQAADKLRFTSAPKASPPFYLTILAAEEKGFWREYDLEVEWIGFDAGTPMHTALAAKQLDMGITLASSAIQAASRGVPEVLVAQLQKEVPFFIWVSTDGRFKGGKDLAGARFGVARFGGTEHAYGKVVAKALGIEGSVRMVSTGGTIPAVAALRSGAIDAVVLSHHQLIKLKVQGLAKELVSVSDYMPKPWLGYVLFAHRDLIKGNPGLVARAVKAQLKALEFIDANRQWALGKMKTVSGYSEEEAKILLSLYGFTLGGKIEEAAVANVRDFLIQYGILRKEKAPRLEELYAREFAG